MKGKAKIIVPIIALVLVSAGLTVAYVFRLGIFNPVHIQVIKVGNMERRFEYYVPGNLTKKPRLVFLLHGSSGTPDGIQTQTGAWFNRLADLHGDAIIVYPAGYHKYWNDCRKLGTYEAKKLNVDEISFFKQMIDWFNDKYRADTNSVFVTGFSNGGQMCYKLAKEKPQWFKGVAAISASLPVQENDDCYQSDLPVSVLVMNGTGDPINPYNGGEVIGGDGLKRGRVLSTIETIRFWQNVDHCDTLPLIMLDFADADTTDHSTSFEYLYQNDKTRKRVALVKIENGGHIVPNPGFELWPKQLGNVNKDINAPEVIWNFFDGCK